MIHRSINNNYNTYTWFNKNIYFSLSNLYKIIKMIFKLLKKLLLLLL
jgi:hypothetical protein